jgi:hypothetical protein
MSYAAQLKTQEAWLAVLKERRAGLDEQIATAEEKIAEARAVLAKITKVRRKPENPP